MVNVFCGTLVLDWWTARGFLTLGKKKDRGMTFKKPLTTCVLSHGSCKIFIGLLTWKLFGNWLNVGL